MSGGLGRLDGRRCLRVILEAGQSQGAARRGDANGR
jgi:hypothetical protein